MGLKAVVLVTCLVFPGMVAALDLQLTVGMVDKPSKDCFVLSDSLKLSVQFKNITNHVVELEDPQKSVATMLWIEVDAKPFGVHPLNSYYHDPGGSIVKPQTPVITIKVQKAYQFEYTITNLLNTVPSNANRLGFAIVYEVDESSNEKQLESNLLELQLCPADPAPQIKEIDSQILKTKNKGHDQVVERVGYGDVKRTLFLDGFGRPMKYVREGGSEDSHYRMSFYYGKSGKLFYTLVEAGAVSGAKYQVKMIFDSMGNRVSEKNQFLTDPVKQGWAFPNPWPNEFIVFDPLTHFKGRSWHSVKTIKVNGAVEQVPGDFDLQMPYVMGKNATVEKKINDFIFDAMLGLKSPKEYSETLKPKFLEKSGDPSSLGRKIRFDVIVNNPQVLSMRFWIESPILNYTVFINFNANSGEAIRMEKLLDAPNAKVIYERVQRKRRAVYGFDEKSECPLQLMAFPQSPSQWKGRMPFDYLITNSDFLFNVGSCGDRRTGLGDLDVDVPFDSLNWR